MRKNAKSLSVNDAGRVVGEDHHRARFTNHDIWLMQELRASGSTLAEIAEKFDTSKGAVHDYVNGRRRAQTAVGQRPAASARKRKRGLVGL